MTAVVQREFRLPQVTMRKPLISLAAFASVLGESLDQVLERIEVDRAVVGNDHVAWAFDISLLPEGHRDKRRREVRVLSHLLTPSNREALQGATFEQILDLIFPPRRHTGRHGALREKYILGTQLQYAWSCDKSHVTHLLDEQSLTLIKGSAIRTGPNGSPAIAWTSITQFLAQRKI